MSALVIRPDYVLFSSGKFDSRKRYLRVNPNGGLKWPSPTIVTLGYRLVGNNSSPMLLYKNGVGGVPAAYSGENPVIFRADI